MTNSRRSTSRTRPYHKGNVAQDLYQAAVKLLDTEPYENVSVRRLASIVGVTPANFYNHYESLSHLLQQIAADGYRKLLKARQDVLKNAKSRQDAARKMASVYLEFAFANQQIFRLMFGYIPDAVRDPALRDAADAGFADFVKMVYGKPVYDPEDLPASHRNAIVAYTFFALLYGLARLSMERQFTFQSGSKSEMIDFVTAAADTFITGSCADPFANPEREEPSKPVKAARPPGAAGKPMRVRRQSPSKAL